MPVCNCETSGCGLNGGVDLSLRIYREHAHADRAKRYEQARIAAEKALQDQADDIAMHLASMTLADQVSEPSINGGRLWGKSPANHNDTNKPAGDRPSTSDCSNY